VTRPDLSVVIPAYNESLRLPRTLAAISAFLASWPGTAEVLVVDDGSRDDTAAVARALGATVVGDAQNHGKGHAVRRGMLAARGVRRLMTDADLSTPMEDLPALMARLDEGYGVAIASRAVAGSRVLVRQPWYRENLGRVFNLWVRMVALPGLADTQCGFKLFSAEAAEAVFGAARQDGFSFDVEALYIARRRGFRIAEVPVTWRNDLATSVRTLQGAAAFWDVLKIRANGWRGWYGGASAPSGSGR
jgi:dolichyl-phosphate beta-glucosyltransferase